MLNQRNAAVAKEHSMVHTLQIFLRSRDVLSGRQYKEVKILCSLILLEDLGHVP